MTKNYIKGWSDDSVWISNTPGTFAKKNLFYVQEAGFFRCNQKYYTKQKDIASFVMILTTAGCGELVYNGKTTDLLPGSLVFLDSMEFHEHRTKKKSGKWEIYWIQAYGSSMMAYYHQFMQERTLPVIELCESKTILNLMQKLIEINKEKSRGIELLSSKYIVELLTELLFAADAVTPPGKKMPLFVRQAMRDIDAHFCEEISLDSIASSVAVSKYHLIKEFKKYTGFAPMEYVISARIGRAKLMLMSGPESIKNIALSVGFHSVSHFINTFKAHTGNTPSQFRQSHSDCSSQEFER